MLDVINVNLVWEYGIIKGSPSYEEIAADM